MISLSEVPQSVWDAVSHLVVALLAWLTPGPNRRHRNRSVDVHRRKDD